MKKLLLFLVLIISCKNEPAEMVIYTKNSKYTIRDLKVIIENTNTTSLDSISFDTEKQRNDFIEKETFLNTK